MSWPLHAPLTPHSRFGSWPVGMYAHVPSGWPVLLCTHASHVPSQAALQHTRASHGQKPLMQLLELKQDCPSMLAQAPWPLQAWLHPHSKSGSW